MSPNSRVPANKLIFYFVNPRVTNAHNLCTATGGAALVVGCVCVVVNIQPFVGRRPTSPYTIKFFTHPPIFTVIN